MKTKHHEDARTPSNDEMQLPGARMRAVAKRFDRFFPWARDAADLHELVAIRAMEQAQWVARDFLGGKASYADVATTIRTLTWWAEHLWEPEAERDEELARAALVLNESHRAALQMILDEAAPLLRLDPRRPRLACNCGQPGQAQCDQHGPRE